MITKKDFAELNNINGSWLPESLRTRLESYVSQHDIEHAINIVADGALKTARAGPYLAEVLTEVLRSADLSQDLRIKVQEALAKAGITLSRVGIKIEETDNG